MNGLNGKSYQENISSLSQEKGLIFEMNGFAGRTIEGMKSWSTNQRVIEVKFEDITTEYDQMWIRIFSHLGFEGKALDRAMAIARKHDIGRMSSDQISQNKHISTGKISKWKEFFSDEVAEKYSESFGDAHKSLGYD